jgi:hypothetical protein
MSHGPEHHIEHAEHATHAAHDPFDRRVTISIAIVAAVLACVTMLGHRAHNETLRLQGEALRHQGLANVRSTDAANKWAYYQSKNLFNFESKLMLDQLTALAPGGDQAAREAVRKKYKDVVDKYDGKLPDIEKEARAIVAEGEAEQKRAEEYLAESHDVHARADRFDYGELGLQLGVVLCSLAILTKNRGYWIAGLLAAVVGTLVGLTGLLGLFVAHH